MRTDKEVYQVFRHCPEIVFEMAGLDYPGTCRVTSETLKEIERRLDGIVRPDDPAKPLTVFEVQFQKAPEIYPRVAVEMALVQQHDAMRGVQGIIFFADRALDPATAPWTAVVRRVYLDEALAELEKRDPGDPVVAVFKPVFEANQTRLEMEAARHYRSIRDGGKYTPEQKQSLSDVYLHWLMERLTHLTQKELAMILDLPDIEDTRCGRDLIERGIERGIEKSILVLARKKFGSVVDEEMEMAVRGLATAEAEILLADLLDLESVGAFRARLAELGS